MYVIWNAQNALTTKHSSVATRFDILAYRLCQLQVSTSAPILAMRADRSHQFSTKGPSRIDENTRHHGTDPTLVADLPASWNFSLKPYR